MTDQVGAEPTATGRLGSRYAVRSGWQVATLVGRRAESPSAATLVLDVPGWPGHQPGQHVDLRLTAGDGYTAERSYSLASAPDGSGRIEVTVQRVVDGEVSPYLVDSFPVGSAVEVRGPVGGWFVWDPARDAGTPVLLLAGGSGLVPLMAMARARRDAGDRTPFRLICSVRTDQDQLYADEVAGLAARGDGFEARTIFTRAVSLTALRGPRRLTDSELAAWGWPPELEPRVYVCGPTGFVETVSRMLVAQGHDPSRVRTERFGPAGG
ncbi:ferredoxin reductase [Promicromonospora thailandica]|uniref:Ferredoxin-NADP reductase n=1 Tax=Promicromonospora thailandica TaxID=765201 RepID=A0A9X2GBZ6_9MICO|nr:ferredoxin reductase [Promicromonospora thailandica]MCP2266979.1 Ferredoxin-NADP reductase [Promicromonospora thailandica]BFF16748.1 ferredoxin reductase [Promicromonospora thailandica]